MSKKPMPDFKNHDERDAYFRDHAEYYTLILARSGTGHHVRSEFNSLAEAEKVAHTKVTIGGGRFLIYGVIGEQSALVKTVK